MNNLEATASRKVTVLMMNLGVGAGGAWTLATAESASAAQRIDMKVCLLLFGTSTSERNGFSWQAALKREGVPL